MYRKIPKGWLKHIDFILLDLLCIQIAFFISYALRLGDLNPYAIDLYRNMAIILAITDLMVIFMLESYKNVLRRGYYKEFKNVVKQAILITLVGALYLFTMQSGELFSRLVLFMTAGFYVVIMYLVRLFWKKTIRSQINKSDDFSLVIVTTSDQASAVMKNIKNNNFGQHMINGLVIADKDMMDEVVDGTPVVANMDNAAECFLNKMWVDEVFFILGPNVVYPQELIDRCIDMGLTVHVNLAKISQTFDGKQSLQKVGNYKVITTSLNLMSFKQAVAKRALDIIAGLAGCFITAILVIIIGPIIYLKSPGPIFFAQERIGQNGKPFKMYKFRSMYMDAEERKAELMKQNKMSNSLMFKLDFDPRIIGNEILPDGTKKTGIGQFIRATSLDEFPQFYNILKGQMSLVGFRPCLKSEYDQYEFHHRARISSKPGLTGMWQVSGRSDITDFEEVVRLDTEYIKNWSIGLDIKILLKTFLVVLKRDGSM